MSSNGGSETPRDLTPVETEVLECYRQLAETLGKRGDDLPPFAQRNATKALAALWQVANGLDADPGHRYDLGI